jgi:hypothetical protein
LPAVEETAEGLATDLIGILRAELAELLSLGGKILAENPTPVNISLV